ncbi:MAG: TetR/AcrR family transcriptional regulator [Pacificimonas sp.]
MNADAVLDRLRAADIQPPTARGRATREKLMSAAERCFADRGFDGTAVSAIASEAGISHGNFYRHFDDKGDILIAVIARLYGDLRASGAERGIISAPTFAALKQRQIAFFTGYAARRHLFRVTREAAARPDAETFRAMWLSIRGIFVDRSAAWIKRCQTAGHVDAGLDAEAVATALGAMTEQLAYVELGLPKADPTPAVLEELGRTSALIWHRTLSEPAA